MAVLPAKPTARYFHAAVRAGESFYLWGGDGSGVASSVVLRFNVPSATWQKPRELSGQSLPDPFHRMATASDGERGFCFGGLSGSGSLLNTLYVIDFPLSLCREIVPANPADSPSPRSLSSMVYHRRQLVVYGGTTGSILDDLFVFDLDTSEHSWKYIYTALL